VPIHGILKEGKKKNNRDRGEYNFGFYKGRSTCGHHVSFDVKMINEGLKRMGLENSKIEVSILIGCIKI
jgi:DNA polymerase-3 subunit epsilon